MGAGALLEPLVVVSLLVGGTWLNRNPRYHSPSRSHQRRDRERTGSPDSLESCTAADGLLSPRPAEPRWRARELRLLTFGTTVTSPNTAVFQDRRPSRLLRRFPFLLEAWYWALIYWVYQLGRAFTALTLLEGTVNVARKHALQLIGIEQRLHLFWEPSVQRFFLQYPALMVWINRTYSFIHIPGTILFLVCLYYFTAGGVGHGGIGLYEARRRTMAMCNLIAFVIFTLWPCMPPRLLSDAAVEGSIGEEARRFGFVDTVHGEGGESSVWTQNRFCNQYAAMPSLHFGYSLLIGLTILTIPLPPSPQHHQPHRSVRLTNSLRLRLHLPDLRRPLCIAVGVAYPLAILIAIIATANHFVLDAVAGAAVCGAAWSANRILLNLLPLEDWFLWCVRIHKPQSEAEVEEEEEEEEEEEGAQDEDWEEGKSILP